MAHAAAPGPKRLFIAMQRARGSQVTLRKVTHQHALRGSDLCRGKRNLINFRLAVHLLESSGDLHVGHTVGAAGLSVLAPALAALSLCPSPSGLGVLQHRDSAWAWSCRLWSWWQQLGHQSIN